MDLYDRNRLAPPNLKYANSSSKLRHHDGTKFEKKLKLENYQFFSHSRGIK